MDSPRLLEVCFKFRQSKNGLGNHLKNIFSRYIEENIFYRVTQTTENILENVKKKLDANQNF